LKKLIFGGDEAIPITMFQPMVFCSVNVYHLSSVNNITSQCLLTWMTFYEKIFALTTCLLVICLILVVCDLVKWGIYYILKQRILLQYLKKPTIAAAAVSADGRHFSNLMTTDLFFIIIMISINVNDVIASEIVNELFVTNRNIKHVDDDDADDYLNV
jgi:hypothetical protein